MEETQKEEPKKSIKLPEIKLNPDVLKWIIMGLLILVAVLLILGIGMRIGAEKAKFSCGWAQNYHENFAGPKTGFIEDWRRLPGPDFIEGHGSVGEIIKIGEHDFVIKDRGSTEKIILVTENTTINRLNETIKVADLKIGEIAVIIGSPNYSGQIEAKLIRIMPALELPVK
jgi:hypothetical protein